MNEIKTKTWIEINTKNLDFNWKNLTKNLDPKIKKMAVIKSNAYGHDIVGCAKYYNKPDVDFLAVDSLEEALEIRNEKIKKPILVLGYVWPENFSIAANHNISLTISCLESFKKLLLMRSLPKRQIPKIHIKIDTGLHRQGFNPNEIEDILMEIKKNPWLKIEGLYSHLASAESKKFKKETLSQISLLNDIKNNFNNLKINPIVHIGASAASLLYSESHFDMVRLGISIYGLWPSEEVRNDLTNKTNIKSAVKLKPALSWYSVVSETKKLEKGSAVGYNFSEKVNRNSLVAIVPVGYWHGVPRNLSKIGNVLIRGNYAKILGTVSMDMIIVDITDIKNVRQGEKVVIIGKNQKKEITADDIASKCKTINYEIVTRLNPLIPRKFI